MQVEQPQWTGVINLGLTPPSPVYILASTYSEVMVWRCFYFRVPIQDFWELVWTGASGLLFPNWYHHKTVYLSCTTTWVICGYCIMFRSTKFEVLRPCSGGVKIFFSWPTAGLTNRVPVWDSWAGAPLYGLWYAFPRPPSQWTGFAMGYYRLWVFKGMGYIFSTVDV